MGGFGSPAADQPAGCPVCMWPDHRSSGGKSLCRPVGDVESLTAAVLELAGDGGLRKTLGVNARALAREDRFDPTHVHERIEQIYRQMLDGVA